MAAAEYGRNLSWQERNGASAALTPGPSPLMATGAGGEGEAIAKAVGAAMPGARAFAEEAAHQGNLVNDTFAVFGMYDAQPQVRDVTGVTFDGLRRMAHHTEPVAAIINRRLNQAAAFSRPSEEEPGREEKAGFRIRLTKKSEQPTREDRAIIEDLTLFFANAGVAEPPKAERSVGWRPGLDHLVRSLVRDSLTLDWAALRLWKGERRPDKWPVAAFAAEDAGLIRRTRPEIRGVQRGVVVADPYPSKRPLPIRGDTEYVKLADIFDATGPVVEFTSAQLATWVRNPRTDQSANGYGYCELEQLVRAVTNWLYAMDHNSSRFRKDALPRGLLTVLGNVDSDSLSAFKANWRQMFAGDAGPANRWGIPLLSGNSRDGANVAWTPFDLSSREMEWSQFMFFLAMIAHALYGIHPEETGWQSMSPFRPPLSEGSPEAKLEYSQDSGLSPLMVSLADLFNWEVLWKMPYGRRYTFEFVGLGFYDKAQDLQMRGNALTVGLTTPRRELAALDVEIPEWLKDCPALDLFGPFQQNVQFLQSLQQQAQAMDQQRQQAEMQRQQTQTQMDQQRFATARGGNGANEEEAGEGGGAAFGGGAPSDGPSQMPAGDAMRGAPVPPSSQTVRNPSAGPPTAGRSKQP